MAEIVNLRMVRKAKARAAREEKAAANRVAHGLTRIEKIKARDERETAARRLDGHRLEAAGPDDGTKA